VERGASSRGLASKKRRAPPPWVAGLALLSVAAVRQLRGLTYGSSPMQLVKDHLLSRKNHLGSPGRSHGTCGLMSPRLVLPTNRRRWVLWYVITSKGSPPRLFRVSRRGYPAKGPPKISSPYSIRHRISRGKEKPGISPDHSLNFRPQGPDKRRASCGRREALPGIDTLRGARAATAVKRACKAHLPRHRHKPGASPIVDRTFSADLMNTSLVISRPPIADRRPPAIASPTAGTVAATQRAAFARRRRPRFACVKSRDASIQRSGGGYKPAERLRAQVGTAASQDSGSGPPIRRDGAGWRVRTGGQLTEKGGSEKDARNPALFPIQIGRLTRLPRLFVSRWYVGESGPGNDRHTCSSRAF
jgi:hypothetical protein